MKEVEILTGNSLNKEDTLSQNLTAEKSLFFDESPNPLLSFDKNGGLNYSNLEGLNLIRQLFRNKTSPFSIKHILAFCQKNHMPFIQEIKIDDMTYLLHCQWNQANELLMVFATDISLIRSKVDSIQSLARQDALTRIANRQYFMEHLSSLISLAKIQKKNIALLLTDLDNFKHVNDSLGHPIGDKLLKFVVRRIKSCTRRDDFMGRLGGDEFVIALYGQNADQSISIAEKINQALSAPFQLEEFNAHIAGSIGIAVYPESGQHADDLIKNADVAMYEAKRSGGNQYVVFNDLVAKKTGLHVNILKKDIQDALEKSQFYMHYQPLYHLEKGDIIGFEAFLRWQHPEKGMMQTTDFLHTIQQNGFLPSLGYWSIQHAVEDFQTSIWKGYDYPLFLNVSLQELQHPEFMTFIRSLLKHHSINPSLLVLDIPNHIMLPAYKNLSLILHELRELGITISLDGFGHDEVFFEQLCSLPFNYLKIHPKILHFHDDPSMPNHSLLKGIIHFSQDLGLKTIQKGVELKDENLLLKDLGCAYAQGFYYANPMPIDNILTLTHPCKNK